MVAAVPNTKTRLSHAFTLRVRGRIVGAVHMVSPRQARQIDTEFEINANGNGKPVDIVPQTLETRELRVARYDLYTGVMEEMFGTAEVVVLTDQYKPFSLREVWTGPGSGSELIGNLAQVGGATPQLAAALASGGAALLSAGASRQYEYTGCWFSDVGRTIDAKGDRVISVDATLVFLDRLRIR